MGRVSDEGRVLLTLRNVTTYFGERDTWWPRFLRKPTVPVRAVDGVSMHIAYGEIVGLVGESGSGKTTLARSILRLLPLTSGDILFEGRSIVSIRRRDLRRLRRQMQMVFQDPHASLSPRHRVAYLLREPYIVNHVPHSDRYSITELLTMVGLPPGVADRYPHELSGGQARRVGIARALALKPKLLVADEPTSGLDVSAAGGVLNLMKELRDRLGLSYLIITHNLSVVGYVADRIAVMYLGKQLEIGSSTDVLDNPAHPYTQAWWRPCTGA